MQCPYCKKELAGNSTFCPHCGQMINQQDSTQASSQNYWNEYKAKVDKAESERKAAEAKVIANRKSKMRTITAVLVSIVAIALLLVYMLVIMPANSYSDAQTLFSNGHYTDAAKAFSDLGEYEDSLAMVDLCKYKQAIVEYEDGNYEKALTFLYPLAEYENSRYYMGQCQLQLLQSAQSNDIIKLGYYNGTPIEWIVLSRSDSDIFMVSKYYVDSKIANESDIGKYGKYTCWSGSTLREWLNGDFIEEAFPNEIADLLLTNTIATNEYDIPNYDGWNEVKITVTTEDKVYIPSKDDVEQYGLEPTSLMGKSSSNLITGWLRDRGHGVAFQMSFEPDGSYGSEWHFYSSYGIRPFIRLALTSSETTTQSQVTEDLSGNTNESIEASAVDTNSPFAQDYWVIFTEGYRGDRVEAASVDSTCSSDALFIIWSGALYLNETNGATDCTQYYLDENGNWCEIGNYSRFTDNASTIIASNLDIYDSNGNFLVAGCSYSNIDWNLIDSYR